MATEELKKVNTGDKIEISAKTWNYFIDAANFVKMSLGTPQRRSGGQPSPCFVTVKNSTGVVLPCYSIVYLSGVAISPVSGSESDFAFDDVVFDATLSPSSSVATNGKMAITQEPLAAGECGKAMIFGVTHATANITSTEHLFVESDGTGALVSSSDHGLPIIWSDGTTGSNKQILVLVNNDSPEKKYTGEFSVRYNSDTDKIEVTWPDSGQNSSIAGRAFLDGEYKGIAKNTSITPSGGFLCLTWDGTTSAFEIVGEHDIKQPRTYIDLE